MSISRTIDDLAYSWIRRKRLCFTNDRKASGFLTPNRQLKSIIENSDITYHYAEFDGDIDGNLGNIY